MYAVQFRWINPVSEWIVLSWSVSASAADIAVRGMQEFYGRGREYRSVWVQEASEYRNVLEALNPQN